MKARKYFLQYNVSNAWNICYFTSLQRWEHIGMTIYVCKSLTACVQGETEGYWNLTSSWMTFWRCSKMVKTS